MWKKLQRQRKMIFYITSDAFTFGSELEINGHGMIEIHILKKKMCAHALLDFSKKKKKNVQIQ